MIVLTGTTSEGTTADSLPNNILNIPLSERPREKMCNYGSEALRDAELLAILLSTGIQGKNAIEVGKEILNEYDGLLGLLDADLESLQRINGLGPAKACKLMASIELGRRWASARRSVTHKVGSPADVAKFLGGSFAFLDKEHFKVLYLDVKNQIVHEETVSVGTLSSSLVHPREVFKPAIKKSAHGLIVAHNHPSGDTTPSEDDIVTTKRLQEAGEIIGIKLIDHLIFGHGSFISLKEKGYLE